MSTGSNRISLFVAALLTSAAWTMPATGQVTDPAPVAAEPALVAAAEPVGAEDIIVTARKRSERIIDIPTSITALGSAELQRYASSNFESIGAQIPQVTITQSQSGTGAVVTIRGIGTNNTGDEGVEQAVSFNIDGVPTSRGRILQQGLFDLDNVQVLKGPQALYFGKNSPGGVIIAQTKGATDTLSGYARAGYEFKAREVIGEGAIGGPITESLGFRVAVRGSDMDGGYVRNVSAPILAANSPIAYDRINGINLPGATYKWGPGTEQYAGRLTLEFDPEGPFKAVFKAFGSHYKTNGEGSQVLQLTCPAGFPNGALRDLGALAFGLPIGIAQDPSGECNPKKRRNTIGSLPPQLSNFPGANGGEPFSRTNTYLASLNLEYQLDDITITSISGYYQYSNRTFNNFDYSTFGLVNGTVNSFNKSYTQEVRAVSSFDGSLNFSVGGFYEHDDRTYAFADTVLRTVDPATGNYIAVIGDTVTNVDSYSVVGELTWKIVPEIELAGGARYTKEEKDAVLIHRYVQPGLASGLGLYYPANLPINARFKADNVSPQVTLSWRPTPDANIFIGYRTGFKSGGISNPAIIPAASTPTSVVFGNETVKGVEGGVKFQSDDRKLRGDVTLYHYIYKGLQVSSFDAATSTLRIQNAGGAQVDGVEASVNYAATQDLSLHSSVGYNRARFTTFANAACYAGQVVATGCIRSQQNLTGRPLPRAPNWQGNVGATFDTEIASGYRLGATVDGRYSGKYFIDTTLSPFGLQKSYVLLDASLRLHESSDRWELALVGRNLTNKFYATFGTDRPIGVSPGSLTGVVGLPRTVQLQGTFNF